MPKLLKSLLSVVVGISFVLLPGVMFAAYNDVSLSTDVVITIGTTAVNINGSADVLETLAVGASSAVLTLEENSTITVLVPSKLVLSASGGQVTNSTCSASGFTATYTTTSGTQTDVTLTVTDEICTITSQSSGGGGGGGSSSSDTTTNTTTDTPVVTTPSPQTITIAELMAQIAALQVKIQALKGSGSGLAVAAFVRNLSMGMTGEDVRQLQVKLNANVATRVSDTGPGSPGNETNLFGAKTKAAVIRFQNLYANEILKPNGLASGTGFVGPSTRAKLNSM
ncbi:MAG TPA: peptidoglycan-binding protein [Candidatus Paceibacterota bacterium]